MLGALDLTPFTGASGDLVTGVGVVGAAAVSLFVATKTFGFVAAWVGKLFKAGKGSASIS